MKYTQREIRFLTGVHRIEHAVAGAREMRAMIDIRRLGCPDEIFNRVLEDRARRLGHKWIQFRSANRTSRSVVDDLDAQIQASRLF